VIVDGLCDPKRHRAVAILCVCVYALVWTLYGVIAKSSQDINADMAEMVIWSRELALGYPSHPPLLAYVLKLWFFVFPLADWAFILLAVLTAATGLYLAFELAGFWLNREKRAAVLFLLAVVPFYDFFALKFDQNSVLIPLWAFASLAFLRSLETRSHNWAALAGIAAAAAMLTKYWSAFLLVALFLTALIDDRRKAYWASPAPWTTAVVFLLAVLPHAIWLIEKNFPPLTWIGPRRASKSIWDFANSLTEYVFGTIGYGAVAIILVALLARPSGKAVRDSWFYRDPKRRPATILFWTPLLLPIPVALAMRTNLLSLWNAPSYTLLPVMMLASPLVSMPRVTLSRLATTVAILTFTVLLASPLVALGVLKNGVENYAAYAKLAAVAVEHQWQETCNCRLRLVGGFFKLANSAAFYMKDRPSTFSLALPGPRSPPYLDPRFASPWADAGRIASQGIALICPADETDCVEAMDNFLAINQARQRAEVALTRHWLGLAGETRRFVIATIPPVR
jgi:hypothetical protein